MVFSIKINKMASKNHGKRRTVPFRRKHENKTDYHKRLGLLKSGKLRFVVRKSNNTVVCQVVEYQADGDKIIAAASSRDLKKQGWLGHTANTSSAYLTGLLVGKKAVKAGVKEAILDMGFLPSRPGAKAFAALKGALDAGMVIPHGDGSMPADDRIAGHAVEDYAKNLDKSVYDRQFSAYKKSGFKPEEYVKAFEAAKNKIMSM